MGRWGIIQETPGISLNEKFWCGCTALRIKMEFRYPGVVE